MLVYMLYTVYLFWGGGIYTWVNLNKIGVRGLEQTTKFPGCFRGFRVNEILQFTCLFKHIQEYHIIEIII